MQIPRPLTRKINYVQAVDEELASRNRYLPPRWGDIALAEHRSEVASWLESVLHRDVTGKSADIIMVRKNGGGLRPLHLLDLSERLAYRAAINTIRPEDYRSPRTDEAYTAFIQAPLSVADCRYVFKTDVAAYYQYIDHERLVDEVVAQTGDDLAVTFAIGLLQETMGRRFGLPQMTSPSDYLADIYISPLERTLGLNGYNVFRYADDFRVACRSYPEALACRELAERAALDLGLTLNEVKTTSPSIDVYRASLDEIRLAEAEVFALLGHDEGTFGMAFDYDEEPQLLRLLSVGAGFDEDEADSTDDDATEPETDIQLEAAQMIAAGWSGQGLGETWTRLTWSALLRKSILVMASVGDETLVPQLVDVLVNEPHLTPNVVAYMTAVRDAASADVIATLDRVTSRGIMSPWQSVWISYAIGHIGVPRRGVRRERLIHWLERQTLSKHDSVVAEAAMALSRIGQAVPSQIGALVDRVTPANRSTLVMAHALSANDASLGTNSVIERFQVRWAVGSLGR